jgi:hypothetical protein
MHDQQPGTSAFTAVGAPQLNTVTNLPEVRPVVHTYQHLVLVPKPAHALPLRPGLKKQPCHVSNNH